MKKLDLVFEIVIDENLKATIECDARDIKTNEITTYTRKAKDLRSEMNSIIKYLENKGFEIYNVTFKALNIG